jgi:hypothetical protein
LQCSIKARLNKSLQPPLPMAQTRMFPPYTRLPGCPELRVRDKSSMKEKKQKRKMLHCLKKGKIKRPINTSLHKYTKESEPIIDGLCADQLPPTTYVLLSRPHQQHIILEPAVPTCSAAAGATTRGRLGLAAAAAAAARVVVARQDVALLPFRLHYGFRLRATAPLPSQPGLRNLHLLRGLGRYGSRWRL